MTKQEPNRAPPLLLIPGTLCDARVFGPLRAALATRAPHPLSLHHQPAAGATSAAALAARILAEAPPRFGVIGFSLGGIIALALAALAPHRVAGLALLAANARPDPPDRAAARRADLAEAASLGHGVFATRSLWPLYPGPRTDPALADLVAAMAADTTPADFAAQTEIAITRPDSRPFLPGYPAPVLALGGGADRLNPPDRQQEIAALAPRGVCHIVPDAGHFVLCDAPADTAAALIPWLAALKENPPS